MSYTLSYISAIWRRALNLVSATVSDDFFPVSANSFSRQCIFCRPSSRSSYIVSSNISTFPWRVLMECWSFDALYYALYLKCWIWCSIYTTLLLSISSVTNLDLLYLSSLFYGMDPFLRQTYAFSRHFLCSTHFCSTSIFWRAASEVSVVAEIWKILFNWQLFFLTGRRPSPLALLVRILAEVNSR